LYHLTKHHGLGNDFLVALAQHTPGLVPDPDQARRWCDRHEGVGADGVLYGLEPADDAHDTCMVLLNADGSEAEISGNGIRCLAQAVLRARGLSEGTLRVETVRGVRELHTVRGEVDGELWVRVDMGPAADGPALGPLSAAHRARRRATVDIGNPHLVLEVPDPDRIDLDHEGPALEAEYPLGMNVEFVAIEAPDRIRLRVWERGSGVTRACGSGAVAAVVAARSWGAVEDRVRVAMPGGEAVVEHSGESMLLTGPSTFVAEIRVPEHT
jgi:diaminopimelate epimerase